ncbi:polysaccharide deacetylase family protein [Aquabacterium sp.]|uniref:polysaccharide deacetylase family protein n=1 Tax=Aquabacterium sp. TaxID=1872578 RepID=UPI0025BDDD3A|nr:polysaccharide deacetylase family protein [Aquabacterium sp.]
MQMSRQSGDNWSGFYYASGLVSMFSWIPKIRRLLAVMALSPLTLAAMAAPEEPAPAAATPSHHEHLHAQVRQAHLNRLRERMMSTPEALHAQCRFESDIATPPPAGLVALTFDDGPDPERTEQILSVLERYDIPATFFFIGEKMQKYPELVRKVLASKRHVIASHSWSHPNFHDLGVEAQNSEITKGLEQMPEDLDVKIYRYPFGNSTCNGNDLLHAKGYRIVGWHVDSCDWAFDRSGTVALHEAVSCGVAVQFRSDFVGHVASAVRERHGGIVLMHEIHANTLAHLNEVIEAIRKDGFTFTRVDDPRLATSLR